MLTSVSGSEVNWNAFRENLRLWSVRETNWEAPGSLSLSSKQLWGAGVRTPRNQTIVKPSLYYTHPKLSMMVYLREDFEPKGGEA